MFSTFHTHAQFTSSVAYAPTCQVTSWILTRSIHFDPIYIVGKFWVLFSKQWHYKVNLSFIKMSQQYNVTSYHCLIIGGLPWIRYANWQECRYRRKLIYTTIMSMICINATVYRVLTPLLRTGAWRPWNLTIIRIIAAFSLELGKNNKTEQPWCNGHALGLPSKGPGFDPRSRCYDFRDRVSPASKSRYDWNNIKVT